MTDDRLRDLVLLVAADDPAAAPALRVLAAELVDLAARLELHQSAADSAFTAPGGCGDRVKLQVLRPDGSTSFHDTGDQR